MLKLVCQLATPVFASMAECHAPNSSLTGWYFLLRLQGDLGAKVLVLQADNVV